jgi:glycosyltransferase involved in cell wall biosynthesis
MTPATTCTIIARNYLAQARVLARSFSEHHPGQRLQVLVIDDVEGVVMQSDEPFDAISLFELAMPRQTLHEMAMCYELMELATALKPSLVRTLLERTAGQPVVYLDPDILVLAPLDDVAPLASEHKIVLTPHTVSPMLRDGKKPSETDVMASGVYNLGFLAVAAGSEPFLDWWAERLRFDALVDHANMLFTDQRWIDLAVSYFDVHLLRDPGFNVAYWNADQRRVEYRDGRYMVGDRPVRFFHFSGFDPALPHVLSKHQGDNPRVLLSEHPAIAALCSEYSARLREEDHEALSGIPYGWTRLPDGTTVDKRMRRAFRTGLAESERGGRAPPDPYASSSSDDLFEWLATADRGRREAPLMPGYLWEIYADRPDLQRAYPRVWSVDESPYKEWLRCFGSVEETIPAPLMPLVLGDVPWGASVVEPAPPDRLRPGLLVSGYFSAELGIGEAARLAVDTIATTNIPWGTIVYGQTASRQQHPYPVTPMAAPDLDTNVVWINPDQLADFACGMGPGFFEGRYTTGNWAWETDRLPGQMAETSDLLDEIWVPSEYTRAAVAASVPDKPVFTFPHPIVRPPTDPSCTRATLGIPGGFVFLFAFDFLSTIARKNPLGVIEAFRRAFKPAEGPCLVVKSMNATLRILDAEQVRLAAGDRPEDIVLIDRCMSPGELGAMIELSDCYVSLHRAEGFGLTIAEAMSVGKPVIATNFSGNLTFMRDESSYLVPYTMTTVGPDAAPYDSSGLWAEPDVDAAAEMMRRVFEAPDEASRRAAAAQEVLAREHGREAAARFITERFDAIQEKRRQGYHSIVADAVRRRLA